MVQSTRRSFLTGLGVALVAAPAIARAGSLMPVKTMIEPITWAARRYDFDQNVFYFNDGVRMLKSVNGGDWVDVSSEYYERLESLKGSLGYYQGITLRDSCA